MLIYLSFLHLFYKIVWRGCAERYFLSASPLLPHIYGEVTECFQKKSAAQERFLRGRFHLFCQLHRKKVPELKLFVPILKRANLRVVVNLPQQSGNTAHLYLYINVSQTTSHFSSLSFPEIGWPFTGQVDHLSTNILFRTLAGMLVQGIPAAICKKIFIFCKIVFTISKIIFPVI